jgi:serine/threonine-protein kinase PpkA
MFDGTLERTPGQVASSLTSPSRRMRRQRRTLTVATFLYARLHNFNAVCQSMAGEELTAFVNEARRVLSESVIKLGGQIAQRRPDSVLAIFSNEADCAKPDHAQRGLHAAILSVSETVQLSKRVAAQSHGREVPVLTLAVGVHLGEGEVSQRGSRSNGMVHAVGEAVEIARLLEVSAADLRWSVAASRRAFLASAGRAESGRIGSVSAPDESFVDILEITGLVPRPRSTTSPQMYRALRDAIAWNQEFFGAQPPVVPAARSDDEAAYFLIEGYRGLRKIGQGGMATVFLGQASGGGEPQVLKTIRLHERVDAEGLQRFIQEFALLAQVNHPHVARILRQGFSAAHAYIAMEYFPGGDLRARMAKGIDMPTAVSYLKQIAAGLGAIHTAGIVHRDLKPDNLMLRHDGTLAIADFGVAKQVFMNIMDTGSDEIVGTPSYLSPEQVSGQAVDARCDLYSLGVLTYEMLTGSKPYQASTMQALLELHLDAPVPRLDPPHHALQPVLDRLMAKDRDERYHSAEALLADLALRGF